jgi:ABC-type sugar transport system, periplasmic component
MKKARAVVVGLVTLVLLMTTVLAGCSGSKKVVDTSSETKGEVVWWGWTPGSPTNEKYIAEFNKEYPDIKVTWKQTSIDDYDAAIKPALANGQGVDTFEVSAGSGNGGVKVFGGQAIDLTDAVKAALGDDYKNKLNEASITTMTVDGKLKALGVGTVYSGNLWINQDLFDKYQVKVPTNFDEWKAACETFRKNGIEGFVQGAGQGAFNMDTFHAIADNVSPGTFTKATRGEVKWTDESIVKALELWKKLFDDGIMQKGALGLQQYPDANNLFMSQKAAMVMMGSWYTSNTLPDTMKAAIESASSKEKPFTMIPINFPDIAGTGKTGSMFGDLDYSTAVSATSKNIKAATTFAVWLGTSQKGQQIIADSLNVVPSLKSATPDWNSVKLVNPEKQNEAVKAYLQNAMNGGDNPRFAGINADMNQAMMDVLAGVAGGTMSPSDGAAQLATTQADSK